MRRRRRDSDKVPHEQREGPPCPVCGTALTWIPEGDAIPEGRFRWHPGPQTSGRLFCPKCEKFRWPGELPAPPR